MKKIILWVVLWMAFHAASYAQQGYSLQGTVTDRSTGEALPGATVMIKNTTTGLSTDNEGSFKFTNLKDNKIELITSFIGYQTDSSIHQLKNGNNTVKIRLTPVTSTLQTINVTAKTSGQNKAFVEQKEAENIKNMVSAEQIEQFPDMNAAEAIQRIPGITLQRDQGEGRYVQLRGTPPELTNFNINGEQIPSPEGNVRYVGMDIISADQIEMIEVTKVLTPDMDGDGIGGTVNVITKKAESDIPDIRATVAGGYNNLRETANYQMQFSYGQRNNKLGFQVNSSYYQNNQGADNLEFKYVKGPFWGSQDEGVDNYHVQYREFQLRHYDITRKRIGLSATLDYTFDQHNTLYLRGMYNNFEDHENRYRKVYDLDDAVSENYYLYGGIDHDVKNRTKTQNITSLNLGGENLLNRIKIDYELSYALASEKQPDYIETRFDNPGQAIAVKFNMDNPKFPKPYFPNPEEAENAYDYAHYEMDELLFKNEQVNDKNYTARLNVEIPARIGDNQGYFKFGGKTRLKRKTRNVEAMDLGAYFTTSNIYPGTGPDLSVLTVEDQGFSDNNLLNQGYAIDHMPSASRMKAFYEYNSQFFIIDRTATKIEGYGTDYEANENIYAGYGMFRFYFNRLMVLGGVRYELTDIDYEGIRILTKDGRFDTMDTLTDTRTHHFVLPQLQFKYMLNETTNLRAAATYTYSRPNFEDVLPYREEDDDEVRHGNPNLKFPLSLNLDLLAEKYVRNGVISGGLFYKNINDFIFYYKRFAPEGVGNKPMEITKALNGNEAFVYGAELQSQFKLSFLPGILSNFGLYLNYTYTYSEAYINQRYPANYSDVIIIFGEDDLSVFSSDSTQERISLPGQAKNTANLAIFYETEKFYAKLAANYHDAFLYELGADKDLDQYYDQAWHLDFTANYSISPHIKVFTDFLNITNAPLRYYLGTPDKTLKLEYYSWWSRVGIKWIF